ncbi:MetQ/NlpA family ABC transporter substrate-binding protein [Treponema sp.]|uniref:MetQ/NlpA family ABC transporter substrate-binding protein n=1 Tax=Treponema sp. TaxID=166 RepID=UPI0025FDF24D|nr:MetQ/NlpA family ABC transporter substrate-binding protein [Treponema sp.]MBR4321723.1 MetQ/NlpA family ABC transporter substrate-binding protein [Treponema sp.]
MKKIIALAAIAFAATSVFAQTSLKVGATPEPHAAVLNLVKEDLKAKGIDLQVVEFTDYVTPNDAVEAGDIDANYFQHIPYLESFNKEKGYHLVNAAGIHVEPFALYSKKIKKIDDLKKKATIAIPNDPTNEGRALLLLQEAGLITLKEGAGITATPLDIKKNPKKLKFKEIEAASLPRVLGDVDAAVINGNYAIPAGLSAKKDGLFVEGSSSPYVNVIAVKAGNENKEEIKALIEAIKSEKVRNYISERYPNGEVVVVF